MNTKLSNLVSSVSALHAAIQAYRPADTTADDAMIDSLTATINADRELITNGFVPPAPASAPAGTPASASASQPVSSVIGSIAGAAADPAPVAGTPVLTAQDGPAAHATPTAQDAAQTDV